MAFWRSVGLAVLALSAGLAVLGPAPAHASRGGLLPPLELELGTAVMEVRGGHVTATQVAVGLSWASLWPKPTPVDVSIGVIGTFTPADAPAAAGTACRGATCRTLDGSPPVDERSESAGGGGHAGSAGGAGGSAPRGIDAASVRAFGGFVATDVRVAHGRRWRAWTGGRGELLRSHGIGVRGAAARASIELWLPVAASSRGGVLFGSFAVSSWIEVGVRERADHTVGASAAAGLGLRLPFVLAY
jgi:hypothetical protein